MVKLGEPIKLKCHSWKKTPVAKVQYFQNGRGKKYSHENSDFYIPEAKLEHSGSYFCRGIIGSKNESSEGNLSFNCSASSVLNLFRLKMSMQIFFAVI